MKTLEELVKDINAAPDAATAECPPGGLAYSYPIAVAVLKLAAETVESIDELRAANKELRSIIQVNVDCLSALTERIRVVEQSKADAKQAPGGGIEQGYDAKQAPGGGISMEDLITNMERMARIIKGQP